MKQGFAVLSVLIVCGCFSAAAVTSFYATDFDALDLGPTQPYPGVETQDWWYSDGQAGHDTIEDVIAQSGRALGLSALTSDDPGAQTIVKRDIVPPDLSVSPQVTLEVDFYAATSDQNSLNEYHAVLEAVGGPHPGFMILGVGLASGNGTPKNVRGVDVTLACYNGTDNNIPVPLTVGQGLAWNRWHHLTLVIDQRADRYVSLTVNDQTETLGDYALPRSPDDNRWKRGQLIETVQVILAGMSYGDDQTDDDVYWDSLALSGQCPLQADLSGDCRVDMEDLARLAAEWLVGT